MRGSRAASGILAALATLAGCPAPRAPADAGSVERDGGSGDVGPDVQTDPAEASADAGTAVEDGATSDAGGYRCARAPAGDGGARDAGVTACNGSASLCARRFDQVAYATTHNAFAVVDEGFGAPNQTRSMRRQLEDGVRALMLDTWNDRGRVSLCHGPCALGRRLLADGLCEINRFLDENPGEVVTLILESYVSAAQLEVAFEQAGLLARLHAQPVGVPWPTLGAMIARDARVVVLSDRDGGARPWLHDVWAHAWETPFSARTPADLETCRTGRGTRGHPLFILNHFLTNPLASEDLARSVNVAPILSDRAARCRMESGQLPNFVTVDYYEIGELRSVIRTLNGS